MQCEPLTLKYRAPSAKACSREATSTASWGVPRSSTPRRVLGASSGLSARDTTRVYDATNRVGTTYAAVSQVSLARRRSSSASTVVCLTHARLLAPFFGAVSGVGCLRASRLCRRGPPERAAARLAHVLPTGAPLCAPGHDLLPAPVSKEHSSYSLVLMTGGLAAGMPAALCRRLIPCAPCPRVLCSRPRELCSVRGESWRRFFGHGYKWISVRA